MPRRGGALRGASRVFGAAEHRAVEPDRPARRRVQTRRSAARPSTCRSPTRRPGPASPRGRSRDDAVDGLEQRARLALEHAVEPRRRDVERARDVDELEQRVGALAVRQPCASQHAARVAPTASSSGRSRRQRSTARGQRGWNAQPSGMASRRGIVPSIWVRRSRSVDDRRDRSHEADGVGMRRAGGSRRPPDRFRRCAPRTSRRRGRPSRRSRPCRASPASPPCRGRGRGA